MADQWQFGQSISISFKLIESQLFRKWPGGAFKLYICMRQSIWRFSSGRLGAFHEQGLLCIEGYLGQWAKALNVSKATISRWLDWMKREGIFWLAKDTYIIGGIQPSIYVLGQVYVSADRQENDTLELFYSDYVGQQLPAEIELVNGNRLIPRFHEIAAPTKQAPIIKDTRLVYFIRGANGKIKIGIAQDIVRRMAELQTGSASKLELMAIAEGGRKYEKKLHMKFSSARIHGEWFEPVPELLKTIDLHEEQGRNLE